MIYGPTFAEMRDPSRVAPDVRARALRALGDPAQALDPINLFNITWKDAEGRVRHQVLPRALTGVDAAIVVLSGRFFPTGSHKVGPGYSILIEQQLDGVVQPGQHTLIWPSTGNYGIGGAWVGPRMGYRSLVVLPEEMSQERFERIRAYGADVIATPGCESNVKEIYDKVHELRRAPENRVMQQFAEMGNYRFHHEVTGNAVLDVCQQLGLQPAAFVSAMGSAGTIAAGDRLKKAHPGAVVVGLEPVQCPTLYNVGFGGHRIEGIGDKHVTWIHNVHNMDYLMCIDDLDCLKGLQVVQEGSSALVEAGLTQAEAQGLVGFFGVSGICNVLGAIRTARLLKLRSNQAVVTVATDSFDRYPSVLRKLTLEHGPQTRDEVLRRLAIFQRPADEYILEGTRQVRERWHNQKYFTWVEQQGKPVEELRALAHPETWERELARVPEIDRRLMAART
jgi:cysteine synthase